VAAAAAGGVLAKPAEPDLARVPQPRYLPVAERAVDAAERALRNRRGTVVPRAGAEADVAAVEELITLRGRQRHDEMEVGGDRRVKPKLALPARPVPAGGIPRRGVAGLGVIVPGEDCPAGKLVQVFAEPQAAGDPDVGELRLHGVEL